MSSRSFSNEEDNHDDTITLDSSIDEANTSTPVKAKDKFVPVKKGGQKLDDTIDLDSSSDEEVSETKIDDKENILPQSTHEETLNKDKRESVSPIENSHYVTTIQSPMQMSFKTPGLNNDSYSTSTPRPQHIIKVAQEKSQLQTPGPFEIEDEFCQSIEEPEHSTRITVNSFSSKAFDNDDIVVAENNDESTVSNVSEDKENNTETTNISYNDESVLSTSSCEGEISVASNQSNNNSRSKTKEESDSFSKDSFVNDNHDSKRDRDSDTEIENPFNLSEKLRNPNTPKKRRLMIESKDLPKSCAILETSCGNGILYLIGTSHFSTVSQEEVAKVIQLVRPHGVLLELCPKRSVILDLNEEYLLERSQDLTFSSLLEYTRLHGRINGIIQFLFLTMSAKITKEMGMAPGGEFRSAVKEAKKIAGCRVGLVDRPIDITFKRALAMLPLYKKIKLAINLIFSESISKEDCEKCKDKDMIEAFFTEMSAEYPELAQVFVHERDAYMAYTMCKATKPLDNVTHPVSYVGIVGMGHVEGIKKQWEIVTNNDIKKIMTIPQTSRSERSIKFGLKIAFYGALLYGGYRFFKPSFSNLKLWK